MMYRICFTITSEMFDALLYSSFPRWFLIVTCARMHVLANGRLIRKDLIYGLAKSWNQRMIFSTFLQPQEAQPC